MKHLMGVLLLLAGSAMAADDIKLVVGEGSSRTCIAPRETARQYATIDAIQHAYELCAKSGDDWDTTGHYELPGDEKIGNPRDVVRCTPCKTDGARPVDGFECTVRLLPQTCRRPAAGQTAATPVSNADWDAKDRTSALTKPKESTSVVAETKGRTSAPTRAEESKFSPAKTGDADICVQVGANANAQFLKNICKEKIVVFWCHSADSARNKDLACGTGVGRYFKLTSVLTTGQSDGNPLSHPLNVTLDYRACYGDISSYQYMDSKGAYRCRPAVTATDPTAIRISTVKAASTDEACKRAQLAAMNHGTPSECACQIRGPTNICQVQSSGPKPALSVTNSLKKALIRELRDLYGCKPEDKDCKPAKSKNAPPATRG